MSASSDSSRNLSPVEEVLHDHLQQLLEQARREDHLLQRIHHLRRMVYHTFNFPVLTVPSPHQDSNDFESSLLQYLESGMDCIVEGFQTLLEQPWRNIHTLDLEVLDRIGRVLSRAGDEQIENCLENLQRYELYWSWSKDHLAMANILAAISELVEGLEKRAEWPQREQREWLFDFVLFFFVQVARVTSSRFGHWEVRMLNQTVRGTGVEALVERPMAERPTDESSDRSMSIAYQTETESPEGIA